MRRFTVTTFFLLLCSSAQSQPLSLEQAARLTFKNNPTIKAAENNTLAAKRNSQAARGLYAPKIAMHGAWVYTQKDIGIDLNPLKPLLSQFDIAPLLALDWNLPLQNRSFGFLEADITIPLFTGGKIVYANKATQSLLRAASAQEQAVKAQMFTTLVERYFGHIAARCALKVREQVVATISEHLQQAEVMFENGIITKAEVLFLRYRLSEAEQQRTSAANTLKLTKQALLSTIGVDSLDSLTTNLFYIENIGELNDYKHSAEATNHTIEYAQQMERAAEQNIGIARAEFMPRIAAMAGGALTSRVSDILPRWAVGVGVSFTIFDGTMREHKYLSAKSMHSVAQEQYKAAQRDIALLTESLYNSTIEAKGRIKTARASIEFSAEILYYRQQAFAEGASTAAEVSDAITALSVAQIELIEAALQFDTTLARLLEVAAKSETFFDYSNNTNRQIIDYEADKEADNTNSCSGIYHCSNSGK